MLHYFRRTKVAHRYHFAYVANHAGGGFAFGSWHAVLAHPIRTVEDGQMIAEQIQDYLPGDPTVVILSWQRFED